MKNERKNFNRRRLVSILKDVLFAVLLWVLLANVIIPKGAGTGTPFGLATAILTVRMGGYIPKGGSLRRLFFVFTISIGVASLFINGVRAVALFLETQIGQMVLTREGAIPAFYAIFGILFLLGLVFIACFPVTTYDEVHKVEYMGTAQKKE